MNGKSLPLAFFSQNEIRTIRPCCRRFYRMSACKSEKMGILEAQSFTCDLTNHNNPETCGSLKYILVSLKLSVNSLVPVLFLLFIRNVHTLVLHRTVQTFVFVEQTFFWGCSSVQRIRSSLDMCKDAVGLPSLRL